MYLSHFTLKMCHHSSLSTIQYVHLKHWKSYHYYISRMHFSDGVLIGTKASTEIENEIWLVNKEMCNSRKYPYFPHGLGIFSKTPPLWKLQLSFIHFLKFFGLTEPPIPQEIPIPSLGRVWIFSGTALENCVTDFC